MRRFLLFFVLFVVSYRQYVPRWAYEENKITVPAEFESQIFRVVEIKRYDFREAIWFYWKAKAEGMHDVKLEKVTTETVELHPAMPK